MQPNVAFALNQRQEIRPSRFGNIVACIVDVSRRQEAFLIGDICRTGGLDNNGIWLVRNPTECHNNAGFAQSRPDTSRSDLNGFVNVGFRAEMRGATLHDIQFNGTNLTSDLFPNDLLQILADTREVFVSKFIGHTRLERSCFRVCNALGNGNDNSLVLCHLLAGIFEELFDGELAFRT